MNAAPVSSVDQIEILKRALSFLEIGLDHSEILLVNVSAADTENDTKSYTYVFWSRTLTTATRSPALALGSCPWLSRFKYKYNNVKIKSKFIF